MKEMLRKRELYEAVGTAKSTVADWIIEFHVFIPTIKDGVVTYYKPEAVDVLRAIKELRELGYAKPDIIKSLMARGFPVTVEEAAKDIEDVLSGADYRDGFMRLMQTTGEAVIRISEKHEKRLEEQNGRLDGHDGQIEALEKELNEVRLQLKATQAWEKEMNEMRLQLNATQELEKELSEVRLQLNATQEQLQKRRKWWPFR